MGFLAVIPGGLFIAAVAAYITHLWWSISTLMGDAAITVKMAVIMIVGVVAAPLGALHGVWLWFS